MNAVPIKRNLNLMSPRELGITKKDSISKPIRRVDGTRGAGQLWEDWHATRHVDMGFIKGLPSPCCATEGMDIRMKRSHEEGR